MAINMTGPFNIVVLVLPLVAGMVAGYYSRSKKLLNVGKLVLGTILVLIFSLGFSIGSNTELLAIMPNVAFNALVLLVMALFFSILFVKAARKLVKI
ncbi:MAG: LysO family transporter [Candidatus Bathyarchaeia archaeon]